MARTEITPTFIKERNTAVDIGAATEYFKAVDPTDGAAIDVNNVKDYKLLIIAKSSGTGALTIKKGDGIQGVADLTATIASGKEAAFVFDFGAFKQLTGANKGKILVTGANHSIAAFSLP